MGCGQGEKGETFHNGSVSAAAGQCPKGNQYTWDPATNPNAVIGTGQGGPGNMYPSYVAAGTLVPHPAT